MAVERNPYEKIPEELSSVVPMVPETDIDATFEVDTDGGLIVDLSEQENVQMKPSEEIAEWYGDLSETLDDQDLLDISLDVIENYQADRRLV